MSKGIFIRIILFALLILTLVVLGSGCQSGGRQEPAPEIGASAPGFVLEDLQGDKHQLSDYLGRIVIINFWTTWCPYCIDEMPYLEDLYRSQDEVAILAVNVQENKTHVQEFITGKSFTFPVLLDEEGEVFKKYRVRALPTTFAINDEGTVTSIKIGAFDAEGLEELIQSAH